MPSLGTLQTKYGKDWLYLNPFSFSGPDAWNVAGTIFVDSNDERLYGVPPMVMDNIDDNYFLSYSIAACKPLEGDSDLFLVSEAPDVFADRVEGVNSYEGEDPVFVNSVEAITVFFFSIERLNSIGTFTVESELPSGYNGNSIASLTTSLPLEATEADGVATVSFDMTTLQDA